MYVCVRDKEKGSILYRHSDVEYVVLSKLYDLSKYSYTRTSYILASAISPQVTCKCVPVLC